MKVKTYKIKKDMNTDKLANILFLDHKRNNLLTVILPTKKCIKIRPTVQELFVDYEHINHSFYVHSVA